MRLYVYDVGWRIQRTKRYSVLKESLSKAMTLFYPLAGHLSCLAHSGSRVELHCNGRGVPIYEAEIPIVIVQLTTFSCGSVRIGLAISHIMADIPSALHFVNE